MQQQITAMSTTIYKNGNTITQFNSIEASINDKVTFVDNSYIDECFINTVYGNENVYPAPCKRNQMNGCNGRIIKIDSKQISNSKFFYGDIGNNIIEMPIVVMLEFSNTILYCNPVNIKVIN